MPGLDASQFAVWGTKLADDYTKNAIDLTENLFKVATENGLNPDQIRRVAEAANVRTYNDMMPSRQRDGEPRFKQACADTVIRRLNGPTKVAADTTDYDAPPKKTMSKVASIDRILADYLEDKPEVVKSLEKRAAYEEARKVPVDERPMESWEAYPLIRKLEKAAAELGFERQGLEEMGKVARERFNALVRRLVNDEGYRIEDLYKAATIARPDQRKALRVLFSEAIAKMAAKGEAGLPKIAEPVAKSLISDRLDEMLPNALNMVMIDGNHPLVTNLNEIFDVYKKVQENSRGQELLEGKMGRARAMVQQRVVGL